MMTRLLQLLGCLVLVFGPPCFGQTEIPPLDAVPHYEIAFELHLSPRGTTVEPTTVPAPQDTTVISQETTTGLVSTEAATTEQPTSPEWNTDTTVPETTVEPPTATTDMTEPSTAPTDASTVEDTTTGPVEDTTTGPDTTITTEAETYTMTVTEITATSDMGADIQLFAMMADGTTEEPQTVSSAMMSDGTTEEPQTVFPPDMLLEVHTWLIDMFKNTTGYMNVTITDSPTSQVTQIIHYKVEYSVEELSDEGKLNSEFTDELTAVAEEISDSSKVFDEWIVNADATLSAMNTAITALTEGDLANMCEYTGYGVCNSIDNTCHHDLLTGTITCASKCTVYDENHNSCVNPGDLETIFPRGVCAIDSDGMAYCQCGMSPGDVMANFFDGERCVSSAFIVGMAAGLGGFLIILFMAIVIGLCCNKDKDKHKSVPYEAYNDPSKNYGKNNQHDVMLDDLEKKGHYVVNPDGHDNKGYHGYQEPLDRPSGNDFRANLSHIDPHADYSIQRPSVRNSDSHMAHGSGGTPVGYRYESIYL